ncbi:MAG: hypothetical protein B7Z14_01870 [Bosea sp. 32-68-6]|nr:MAG: hypothetical protein B7Z14_01870 [Bosea sp. 32-68-6]
MPHARRPTAGRRGRPGREGRARPPGPGRSPPRRSARMRAPRGRARSGRVRHVAPPWRDRPARCPGTQEKRSRPAGRPEPSPRTRDACRDRCPPPARLRPTQRRDCPGPEGRDNPWLQNWAHESRGWSRLSRRSGRFAHMPPRISATCGMSLSPRPQRFITIR